MRFKIKAHYGNNSSIQGYVEADSASDALRQAENLGMMDDPDADDWSAILAPAPTPAAKPASLGTYREQMIDAGRGHLLSGKEG